jgi:hypothetical protein
LEQRAKPFEPTRHRRFTGSEALRVKAASAGALPVTTLVGPMILNLGALVSIVKDLELAAPALPTGSTARTRKSWLPSASERIVWGEEHSANSCESSRHLNREPASFAWKLNDGLGSDDAEPFAGPEEIVVVGPVVSTVKKRDTVWLSGPSTAITENWCRPSLSREVVNFPLGPEPQSAHAAPLPPNRHLKPAAASLELNLKLGVGSFTTEPGAGPASILTSTGGASTVQVTVAGGPVLPARSVPTTSNVCCALLSLLVGA